MIMKNRRNLRARIRLLPALLLAAASSLGSLTAETEILFAEDVSVGKKGVNAVPRQAYPHSKAMAREFKWRLGGTDAVDFENVNLGSLKPRRLKVAAST